MPYLFLAFIAVPVIEIALFMQVGSAIGSWSTIAIVILTAVLGTWLLRQQGMATLIKAQKQLQTGQLPATAIIEAALLLVGGALLLTPGFMTDAIGFLTLVPVTRRLLATQISRRAGGLIWSNVSSTQRSDQAGHTRPRDAFSSENASDSQFKQSEPRKSGIGNENAIEGEFRREDPE